MIRRPIQALALFSCLALAACGGSAKTAAPSAPAASAPDALACAPSTADGTVGITIQDFEFVPKSVTAKVGDIVAFTNSGAVQHTATLDEGDCGTGKLAPGATGALTFSKPGTYRFHCAIHSSMTGSVVVS
jgi:plastocyanin